MNNKVKKNKARIKNKEYKQVRSDNFRIFKAILILIAILIVIFAIRLGIQIVSWQSIAKDMISNTPSTVLDKKGEVIAEIGSNKITSNISISDIPKNLKNAYVSIEDQRFYSHAGVDLPRTGAAILSYIKNLGSSSFGGSSITQQLVKNLTGDTSSSISRKVNEWTKAFGLEMILDKNEILEAYLNIIYVGPNIYGVNMGAKYYFNKSVSDLSLAECAFLAGINNAPNSYNPFDNKDNKDKITIRTKAVLEKMLELEYINNEEYNLAVSEVDKGLNFKKGNLSKESSSNIFSYHTDALLTEIIDDISEQKNITKDFAENYLEMAGLKIYSTQDSKVQKAIETEVNKSKYKLKSADDSSVLSQAAMVVIDNETGYVVGCIGGIGEKTSRGFNRATQALRQTGSAGKPISVLAPAIDKKIITAASIYVDEATTFDDGTEEGYSPTDYNNYRGAITVRQAVESSQNIPFVKIMEELTPKESINYMKKLGITTLTKTDDNLNLALGGLEKGISPLEMAAAYHTIANDGKYVEPTFYTKAENSYGKTVVKSRQKKKQVMSESVAFILQNLLKEPVDGLIGTAKYCKINGIDVAAKTGTTNDDYDRWLCGFTPYYTAVTWFGFDLNETIKFNNKNPSGQIWASVMKEIHSGLLNKEFDIPNSGVITANICSKSGLLANSSCTSTYYEYFIEGTVPTTHCTQHSGNPKSSNSLPTTSSIPESQIISNTTQKEIIETHEQDNTPFVPDATPIVPDVNDISPAEPQESVTDNEQNNAGSYETDIDNNDDFISDDDEFEQ